MSVVLFESGKHRCIVFNDLVCGDDGIQANQFLIQNSGHSAVLDPGGSLLYNPLVLAMASYLKPAELDFIICSHQDPDIVGAVDKWLLYTQAKIVCSELWGRFVPHIVPGYMQSAGQDRYFLVPDQGGEIRLGNASIYLIPGHFMHSVGNFGIYDPISRILFSGDIGASLIPSGEPYRIIEDGFETHAPRMQGFHRRYMTTNKVLRLWVEMVREISPAMIVPQHGFPMTGKAMKDFLTWLRGLECGVDLLTSADYQPWKNWKDGI